MGDLNNSLSTQRISDKILLCRPLVVLDNVKVSDIRTVLDRVINCILVSFLQRNCTTHITRRF